MVKRTWQTSATKACMRNIGKKVRRCVSRCGHMVFSKKRATKPRSKSKSKK